MYFDDDKMFFPGDKAAAAILKAAIECNDKPVGIGQVQKPKITAMVTFTIDKEQNITNVKTDLIPYEEMPEEVKRDPYWCENGWNYVTAYRITSDSISVALKEAMHSRKTWLATAKAGDAIEKPKRTPEEYMDIAVKNLIDRENIK